MIDSLKKIIDEMKSQGIKFDAGLTDAEVG
jgi:hypothetical protein